ncbi:hypothetical protein THERMOS_2232 [Bathymodiolus thermophilus thioautotrophic gill symbiont]|uniref:Uncharacterized protein n=1 Tax=Bathymodiolus thermophilus thioautotrophic gill symbiont TaxID=2360 RepID=A0A8H9CGM7_9GAMM|nr:hypothetical protein THERMOS_2232 [Bathymodiolus thermophilus thioautotrophic gill symbiont]
MIVHCEQGCCLFKIEDPCIKLKNPTKNHKSTLKTLCKH